MTYEEFSKLLITKHPQAEVRKTSRGLDINYTPNSHVYSFKGTIERIAEQMRLVELWYIEDGFGVVGKAHSQVEANQFAMKMEAEEDVLAEAWKVGATRVFTIRRVS